MRGSQKSRQQQVHFLRTQQLERPWPYWRPAAQENALAQNEHTTFADRGMSSNKGFGAHLAATIVPGGRRKVKRRGRATHGDSGPKSHNGVLRNSREGTGRRVAFSEHALELALERALERTARPLGPQTPSVTWRRADGRQRRLAVFVLPRRGPRDREATRP